MSFFVQNFTKAEVWFENYVCRPLSYDVPRDAFAINNHGETCQLNKNDVKSKFAMSVSNLGINFTFKAAERTVKTGDLVVIQKKKDPQETS